MIVGSKERLAIEEKKMCVEQILEFLTPENDKGKKNNGRQSFSSKEQCKEGESTLQRELLVKVTRS